MSSNTCTLTVPFIPFSSLLSISKDSVNVKEMTDMCFRNKESDNPLSKEDAYCCYDKCKSLFIDGGDDETEQTMFFNNPLDEGIGTNIMETIRDGTQVRLDSDTSSYNTDTVVSQCGNVLKYNFAKIIDGDDQVGSGWQNRVDLRNICKKNSFYDESHKESFLKSFKETRNYDYIIDDDGKYPNPMFTDICGCYYPDDWEKRFMKSWTNTHLPGASQGAKDRAIANRSNIKKQCNDALCNISSSDLNYVGTEFSELCSNILCIQSANTQIGLQTGGSQNVNQEMNCAGEEVQDSNTPGNEDTSGDTSEDTSGDTSGDTGGDTGGDTSGDTGGQAEQKKEGEKDKKEKEEESSGISNNTMLAIGGIIFFFFFMLMFMILIISM